MVRSSGPDAACYCAVKRLLLIERSGGTCRPASAALAQSGTYPPPTRMWSGAALAPARWLLLTLALVADEGPDPVRSRVARLYWPISLVIVGIGLTLVVIGMATDLIERWSDAVEL